MIKHLEVSDNFNEEIKTGTVLVDFFATWCGPCKMLGPVLEKYAEVNENIKILKVDVDMHPELAKQFGIMSVPTMIVFKDNNEIKKELGFRTANEIDEMLK